MHESTDSTRLGANRTGLQSAIARSKEMLENTQLQPLAGDEVELTATAVRREYVLEADPLGSVPPPKTLKGVLKSGAQMMLGARPQAFVDKLAERLAFERGGTRLYDAVLVKVHTNLSELPSEAARDIETIRNQEADHAALIAGCIEKLGADPTAQTPGADLVGVQTMGFIQAVSDPRTTLAQTLNTALAAEVVDGAGWELLIALAEDLGQEEMAEEFRKALAHELQHAAMVKRWVMQLTLETAGRA